MVEGGVSRQRLRASESSDTSVTSGTYVTRGTADGTVTRLAVAGSAGPRPPRPRKDQDVVLYLDANPLARACFAGWLSASLRAFSIVPAASVADLPLPDIDSRRVRLVLANLWGRPLAPGELDTLLDAVSLHCAEARVALLSERDDIEEIAAAIGAGVHGFIPVSLPPAVAGQALLLVLCGGVFAPVEIVSALRSTRSPDAERGPRHAALTPRQNEIVDCIRRGMANKEIGYALSLSESAVKGHVRSIMRKLGAQNRTQVAYLTGGATAG
jgi:DNA-binding NarL/FixJ family response regulator